MRVISEMTTWAFMSLLVIAVSINISYADDSNTISVATNKQIECLAQNIYHEAGHESFDGKIAVAQVTVNRANSRNFPSTVCGVVQQKIVINEKEVCQFSWVCDPIARTQHIYTTVWEECVNIARAVLLEGLRLESLEDALYFHNSKVKPNWGLAKVASIGGHTFYSGEKVSQIR